MTLVHVTKLRKGGQKGRRRKEGRKRGRKNEGEREGKRKREIGCIYLPAFCYLMKLAVGDDFSPLLLDAYSAAFGFTVGFSSSCAHPPANSHEINSTHPSFYLHHLAEAKITLPKYPLPDKTYHPITIIYIHLACNCVSGLGSFEIRDLFLLPLSFIREGLSSMWNFNSSKAMD